ncbi:MAG: FmdB family zinc ribbon protein [Verrucomicrobiales bacterium]
MPNYDYSCAKCGKTFEVFQSMKDPRLESCPDETCGGAVRRLLGTGAGIIFKGSGFYATDYRSSTYKESAKKDAPSAPAESKPSSSCCSGGSCSSN